MSAPAILAMSHAATVEALGWTLLHFVWQGTAIALALSAFLFAARRTAPQVRYLAGLSALCLMCAAAVSTLIWHLDAPASGEAQPSALARGNVGIGLADSDRVQALPTRTDSVQMNGAAHDSAHRLAGHSPPRVNVLSSLQSPAISVGYLKSLPQAAAGWGQRLEPWLPSIVGLWALGVALFSVRLLSGWQAVSGLRATAGAIPDAAWLARFSRLKERLGISQSVQLACSTSAVVPMVIGALEPLVLLPAALFTGLSTEQVEAIIAHELVHIRRHDYLVNLLQNVVETLFFYHPAVAWVSGRIRVEREHCCDDAALVACGGVLDYARALAALAELRRVPALGVAATGGSVADRIRRLGGASADPSRKAPTPLATLLLLLAALGSLAAITADAWARQKSAAGSPAEAESARLAQEDHGHEMVVRGQVLQPDGRPAAGARVAAVRYETSFSPRPSRTPFASAIAGKDGKFELTVSTSRQEAFILAEADGFGFRAVDWGAVDLAQPLILKLTSDSPIRGRVLDLEGRPVPGVRVLPTLVSESKSGNLDSWLQAVKSKYPSHLSWQLGKLSWIAAFDDQSRPVVTTDSDGRFTLKGIGPERLVNLELSGESTALAMVTVATRPMPPLTRLILGAPSNRKDQVFGSEFTCQVRPSRLIVGTVSEAATGKPLKGVGVGDRGGRLWAETDAQGRYRLAGTPKASGNQIVAFPNDDQPYFMRSLDVPDSPGIGPITVDIELHRGLWITGRVIDQVTRQPVMAQLHYLPFLDNPSAGKFPEFQNGRVQGHEMRYATRPDGTFRLVGLPGRAIVGAQSITPNYRTGIGADQIQGADENGHFPTFSNPIPASVKWPTAIREINPADGTNSVNCDFVLDPGGTIRIALVDRNRKPVSGSIITGRANRETETSVKSRFDLSILAPKEISPVLIFNKNRTLGKALMLTFDEKMPRSMTVTLEPTATVTGRIVDEEGVPMAAVSLQAYPAPGGDFWPEMPPIAVQPDGRFKYGGLLAGADYIINAFGPSFMPQRVVEKVTIRPGKSIDLGDIKFGRR
jgi:beta-lactamase regulating signal transducer with metallopeptidase domain